MGTQTGLRLAFAGVMLAAGIALLLGGGQPFPRTAYAQSVPSMLSTTSTDAATRERKNQWTVGVSGGQLSGSYMTFADELAKVLDDGDNLRILPVVTYGAASNLDDLLYLRGIDVAMTQSDVFEYFRNERKINDLANRVNYVVRLPISEVHVLAANDVASLQDLRGKPVNFGPDGSASSLTGTIVFQRLGVKVQPTNFDNSVALQKLKAGEIAALVRVINKPLDYFSKIPANAGLHLVPIPYTNQFEDLYTLGEFTPQEYPTLVPAGSVTDTLAVPAVLAVYNWPKGSDRYRKVQRFVEAFFNKFDQFQMPPRHPKWRDVNLSATVPGWTRWSVAEEMLKKLNQAKGINEPPTVTEFSTFLKQSGVTASSPEARAALFKQFLQWQAQKDNRQTR